MVGARLGIYDRRVVSSIFRTFFKEEFILPVSGVRGGAGRGAAGGAQDARISAGHRRHLFAPALRHILQHIPIPTISTI